MKRKSLINVTEPMEENIATMTKPFELPSLSYEYDEFEPFIDKRTMEIHHRKHHGSYVDNLNKALKKVDYYPSNMEEIIMNISKYSEEVRNNGGGHYNHSFFWKIIKPVGEKHPVGDLSTAIIDKFGSFENFKDKFNDVAKKHFGSGWTWLVLQKGKLEIGTTPNQDNPLMNLSTFKGTPILGLDVWEHAYYLKHQNRRIDYIIDWWNIVDWEEVEMNFQNAE